MRRSERAFTLLEVLGAVALLGIVYVTLSRSAIEGLRSEGESRRRLEASLLADARLSDLELQLESGAAPPLGRSQDSVDEFTVVTEVRAFEPPKAPKPGAAPKTSAPKGRADPFHPPKGTTSLFGPPPTGLTPALEAVDIVVRWGEGDDEREVRRSTWALDRSGAEALFEIAGREASERAGRERARERDSERQRNKERKAGGSASEAPAADDAPPFGEQGFPDAGDLPQLPEEP